MRKDIKALLSYARRLVKVGGYDLNDSHWCHATDNNPFYEYLALAVYDWTRKRYAKDKL